MAVSSQHSVTECPSEIATKPSMTEEIEDLLSNPMFAMTGEPSTQTSPRRPPLAVPNNPAASRGEDLPEPGETLPDYLKQPPPSPHGTSQVGMGDITAHSSCSPSPTPGMPERDTINLSDDMLHLQGEMNDATVHLLTAKASIDTCHQRIISKTEVSHCQNEINLAEAIKEVKARYTTMIGDAESTCMTAMRKEEATHSASTWKLSMPLELGKQKLPMWCKLQNCNGSTRKLYGIRKRRALKWRSILANSSCRPVEWPSKPAH